jgi:RIO kinase 1
MTLKRKGGREYSKDLKIVRGAFDERTMLVLYRLLNKKKISVESLIKEGKESVILSGLTKDKKWIAIKVYCIKACNFKNMSNYLIGDPRFHRVKKTRRFIINLWCQREFKNLKIAKGAGVNCPKPLFFKENILIMNFIGDNGRPAPRLIDVRINNPEQVYEKVIEDLIKLTENGLIHGDLSPYNILFYKKPYFIDFSHGTLHKSPIAPKLLKRDIKNVNNYFSKLGVDIKDTEKFYKKLERIIRKKVIK